MLGQGENGLKDKNRSISQLPAALQASLHSVGIPVRLFDSCSSPGLLTKSPIAVLCVQLWKAAVCLNKQQTQPFSTAWAFAEVVGLGLPCCRHSEQHTASGATGGRSRAPCARDALRAHTSLWRFLLLFSYFFIFFFNKQGSQCSANTTRGTQARAST